MSESTHPQRPMPIRQFTDHPRNWRTNAYVYPVISRRSGGVSIGVNLNPDRACNFDCIYCQVDRSLPVTTRWVDPERLREELADMLEAVRGGRLFDDPQFADVPDALRTCRDIAFSGDGEPTACPEFARCARIVADVKRQAGATDVKIVLITDAAYLTRPAVVEGLTVMDDNQGEIWAKLDAGTQAYYQRVNRPNVPLAAVLDNITRTARARPIVIQSMFMRIDGAGPDESEIDAYVGRLRDIVAAGGTITTVQVYTVARRPAQDCVSPLTRAEVDRIAECVREDARLPVVAFYGSSDA